MSSTALSASPPAFSSIPLPSVPSLDTTWYLNPPDPLPSPTATQPPNSSPFPINSLSCGEGTHAPPSVDGLASYLASLNLTSSSQIQLYQSPKGLALYRSYYLLKHVFKHTGEITILQTPYTTPPPSPLPSYSPYTTLGASLPLPPTWGPLVTKSYVKSILSSSSHLILDARPYPRFTAEVKETRPGCKSGHIKGSKSLPFPLLCSPDLTSLLSPSSLRPILQSRGVSLTDPTQKIILTCGSGVTACYIAVALEACGVEQGRIAVYEGSWAEWGTSGEEVVEGPE
ncbi:hypothetical protein TrST_g6983 [Triparma strigata]|uniref:Rhodanese domain-containing protein n=1 Tax=Triparma strigata TaxID=1606541 RepID=A0A9W7EJH6_9STRA|nr:hypothetical protein TrST_g6983 [Triparma strigata]